MSVHVVPSRARLGALQLAAVPLAALSLAVHASDAEAGWAGVNGRISLTQRVPAEGGVRANRDVFAYARDVARARVTTSPDNEEQSSWSPDGRWVAYKRREAVFVAPWDGSVEPQALTKPNDGQTNNTQPAWSSDGRSIVFRSNRGDPSRNVADVWVMDSPSPRDLAPHCPRSTESATSMCSCPTVGRARSAGARAPARSPLARAATVSSATRAGPACSPAVRAGPSTRGRPDR